MDNETKDCQRCQEPFRPAKYWQRFCGSECRIAWHKETKRLGEAAAKAKREGGTHAD